MTRRDAMGPLRRLSWSREPARPDPYGRFWNYALPLGLLGLSGLGLVAGANPADTRPLDDFMVVLITVGPVLPVVITLRLPVIAWRLAFLIALRGLGDGVRGH